MRGTRVLLQLQLLILLLLLRGVVANGTRNATHNSNRIPVGAAAGFPLRGRKGRQTRAVIAIVPVIVALYEMPKLNSLSAGSRACMVQLNGAITTAVCLDDRHIK